MTLRPSLSSSTSYIWIWWWSPGRQWSRFSWGSTVALEQVPCWRPGSQPPASLQLALSVGFVSLRTASLSRDPVSSSVPPAPVWVSLLPASVFVKPQKKRCGSSCCPTPETNRPMWISVGTPVNSCSSCRASTSFLSINSMNLIQKSQLCIFTGDSDQWWLRFAVPLFSHCWKWDEPYLLGFHSASSTFLTLLDDSCLLKAQSLSLMFFSRPQLAPSSHQTEHHSCPCDPLCPRSPPPQSAHKRLSSVGNGV